ncbi:hypothetical protein GGS21DRAFT_486234 [Xylaria nigripes]|nr:hypothetical protein GGS21DRAFT_486234 [Xylaria nigripes]
MQSPKRSLLEAHQHGGLCLLGFLNLFSLNDAAFSRRSVLDMAPSVQTISHSIKGESVRIGFSSEIHHEEIQSDEPPNTFGCQAQEPCSTDWSGRVTLVTQPISIFRPKTMLHL